MSNSAGGRAVHSGLDDASEPIDRFPVATFKIGADFFAELFNLLGGHFILEGVRIGRIHTARPAACGGWRSLFLRHWGAQVLYIQDVCLLLDLPNDSGILRAYCHIISVDGK